MTAKLTAASVAAMHTQQLCALYDNIVRDLTEAYRSPRPHDAAVLEPRERLVNAELKRRGIHSRDAYIRAGS